VADVKTLTDATFDTEVKDAGTPLIVDFWAPWCGPCRMVGPVIDEIAQEHGDKITVGKVNVDENPSIAQKFGIMSIPTIILFKDGEPAKKVIGARWLTLVSTARNTPHSWAPAPGCCTGDPACCRQAFPCAFSPCALNAALLMPQSWHMAR
jgi:thioredoxin 1